MRTQYDGPVTIAQDLTTFDISAEAIVTRQTIIDPVRVAGRSARRGHRPADVTSRPSRRRGGPTHSSPTDRQIPGQEEESSGAEDVRVFHSGLNEDCRETTT